MKTIKIKELGIEVETELHTEMNRISLIKIPEGWRLLTMSEWLFIYNRRRNEINLGGKYPDEVIEQPIEENKNEYPYWNIWFGSLVGRSVFNGYNWNLSLGSRVRGVRFCRDVKGK